MILQGQKIQLRPMTKEEVPLFYKWATKSDAAPCWYGELYGDKVPTYEEFIKDWKEYYFTDEEPDKGRCFIILAEDKPIGQINYNKINSQNNSTELDIIIAEDIEKGKGYGSDALKTLINYLFQELDIKKCWVEVIANNPRAIKAYQKAGFEEVRRFSKKDREWLRMEVNKMNFQKADAILVMGRGIKPNGGLPQGTTLRAKLAANLFNQGLAPKIITTSKGWGFQNFKTPIPASESMKRFIVGLGIPENVILKDEKAEDTIGEAYFSRTDIIDKHNWKKLIIITSTDHLERTKFIFSHIFGPDYNLQFVAAEHGLSDSDLRKSLRIEKKAFLFAKKYLKNIAPGDINKIKKMLFTKHIMYNGSILKPILKFFFGKPPYNK